jgi:hypothetical protein
MPIKEERERKIRQKIDQNFVLELKVLEIGSISMPLLNLSAFVA